MATPSQLATEDTAPSTGVTSASFPRMESIDIFRGFTVLLMIFVDNLGFVNGLPWWTYHMPREANGMTYVDMVFPAFLFLMGMSIPLALDSRAAKGLPKSKLWLHVVLRSVSLVVLGLFVANAPQVDSQHTGIGATWWATLGFIAIALAWCRFPGSEKNPTLYRILKYSGFGSLICLAVVFRRTTPGGQIGWLDFSDWEILGLLGWAYFLVCAIYLLFQKRVAVLVSAFVVLIAINALSTAGHLSWIDSLLPHVKPFEAGLSAITMSGLLVSLLFVGDSLASTFAAKAWWALGCAAILFGAGWVLSPLGISKIRDTPTWCLYCAAANTLIVVLLYWFTDVNDDLRWAGFTKVVGTNPLLSYFLPYVAYFVPALGRLTADGTSGWPGVAKSIFFTVLILAIVTVLDRLKIKLQL